MLKSMVIALVLTLVLEWGFALLWGVSDRDDYKLIGLANVLTNPAVNLLFAMLVRFCGLPALPILIILEISAITAEWFCYRSLAEFHYPFLFSLCANAFSYCTGYLLQLFF